MNIGNKLKISILFIMFIGFYCNSCSSSNDQQIYYDNIVSGCFRYFDSVIDTTNISEGYFLVDDELIMAKSQTSNIGVIIIPEDSIEFVLNGNQIFPVKSVSSRSIVFSGNYYTIIIPKYETNYSIAANKVLCK